MVESAQKETLLTPKSTTFSFNPNPYKETL